MTQKDSAFAGSIPEIYDTYLVPLIFEVYANDLNASPLFRQGQFWKQRRAAEL